MSGTQPESLDLISFAEERARRLRGLQWDARGFHPGPPDASRYATQADLAEALEFMIKAAGSDSALTNTARSIVAVSLNAPYRSANEMASVLERWIEWKRSGLADVLPFEQAARIEAATDLMEQVDSLLQTSGVHPAAPIVLAGAALEERLRAMVLASEATVVGREGLDSYGTALKKVDAISATEAKQVTYWAGLRNQAAHGDRLEELDIQNARHMAEGISLFLQKHQR